MPTIEFPWIVVWETCEAGVLATERENAELMPGTAVGMSPRDRAIRIPGAKITGEMLYLLLRELDGEARYLTETGWSTTPFWIESRRFTQLGDDLVVGLPARLVQSVPADLLLAWAISWDGENFDNMGDMVWRIAGTAEHGDPTAPVPDDIRVRYGGTPVPAPETEPAQAHPHEDQVLPSATVARESKPKRKKRSKRWIGPVIASLVVLLIVGGGGYAAYDTWQASLARAADVMPYSDLAPDAAIREIVGDTNLDNATKVTIADTWLTQSAGNEAFLLLRMVATDGYGPAALRMAVMTDPLKYDRNRTALARPDPYSSACWYIGAAAGARLPEPPPPEPPTLGERILEILEGPVPPPPDPFEIAGLSDYTATASEGYDGLVASLRNNDDPLFEKVSELRANPDGCN